MTKEKVLEVIKLYESRLSTETSVELDHCKTMFIQMRDFILEDRMDKVFRWLGFVQGVLWCEGIYTIEQMKDHNRP